ncbi:cyanophycin synthetase [Singulisphaera sp. PoT]|uniref:cyanophycin synthetase n=1 Tax=Singulisphaera sp. PoT TaxID=3411797 RepID=UPI003BF4EF90
MTVRKVLLLRGPNVWARVPLLEVWLDPAEIEKPFARDKEEITKRLMAILSQSQESVNGRTSALETRLASAPNAVEFLGILILELQTRAGAEVEVLKTRWEPEVGVARLAVQYQVEQVAQAALQSAIRLFDTSAGQGGEFDVDAEVERLKALTKVHGIGPNTAPVVAAAKLRGIPVRRLNADSLIQLGHGVRQRRFQTAATDRTPAVAESISDDKDLTKDLLRSVGVPVPDGRPVTDAEDAWAAAVELGGAVVVKPRDADHGDGISLNLTSREQVLAAYALARDVSSDVMVEQHAPGAHHRLLVVGDRVVAAARRDSAHVIGDGQRTVAQLVAEVNKDPRRGTSPNSPLRKIELDEASIKVLSEDGYATDSIPPAGTRVLIRRNSHMKDGGDNVDVTDLVHPEVAARAVDATQVIGLDLAGLDVVVEDISRPLEEQKGVIVEVNANPWLRQHLKPWNDPPRPVGEAIVAALFPHGENGRIPTIVVTGTSGKTTTSRIIAHLFKRLGKVVGMSSTDGIYIDGRRIETGDCSGPQSAHTVFLNPIVEVAVLETAQGGIIREGLAFDQCDVSVVTNLGEGDHLELRGVDTLEALARVKRTVVEAVSPTGFAVLNADDPLVSAMAEACPGNILWFSRKPENRLIEAYRAQGGRAITIRDGSIVLIEDTAETLLIPLADVPLTHGGRAVFQVENVLAAAGGAWALGLSKDDLRDGLASFGGDPGEMPARFNVWQVGDATVVVDFPHNSMALEALIEAAERFPHKRRVIVFAGCNRRDADVIRQGELLGDGFDEILLYKDKGNQDRKDGELNALLRQGLEGRSRPRRLREVEEELIAIETALAELQAGDLLILGVERIEESLEFVRRHFGSKDSESR